MKYPKTTIIMKCIDARCPAEVRVRMTLPKDARKKVPRYVERAAHRMLRHEFRAHGGGAPDEHCRPDRELWIGWP